MDAVLNVCIADGKEIEIDGADEISFYNEIPELEVRDTAYNWHKGNYHALLNHLAKYAFIGIKRGDSSHVLEYGGSQYAFSGRFEKNTELFLKTSGITTITDIQVGD